MHFAAINEDTEGFAIDTAPLNSDVVAVTRAILDELDVIMPPIQYVSSVGLTVLPSGFDDFYLSKIYNDPTASKDYDNDGLSDYDEIAFNSNSYLITEDPITGLLTFATMEKCIEYINYKKEHDFKKSYVGIQSTFDRYLNREDETLDGSDLVRFLFAINIVAIYSDPLSADGDGDGILDFDEYKWNEIDERYKYISPLKADTVESLYPELTDPLGHNQKDNPVYLEIQGNNIKINIKYAYYEIFPNISSDQLLEGAKYRWSHSYDLESSKSEELTAINYFKGKLYDFYPGMKITVELNFIKADFKNVKIHVEANIIGNSFNLNWGIYKESILYINRINHNEINSDEELISIFSHELGHSLGLYDAYKENNNKYEIFSNYIDKNLEIPFYHDYYTFNAGDIMLSGGLPSANDIEMILQAFSENEKQYYTKTPKTKSGDKSYLSKSIKNPILIFTTDKDNEGEATYYRYDRILNDYIEIGNFNDVQDFIRKNIYGLE
jgi:hypothetical protein